MKLDFDEIFFGMVMFSLSLLSIALFIAIVAMVLASSK